MTVVSSGYSLLQPTMRPSKQLDLQSAVLRSQRISQCPAACSILALDPISSKRARMMHDIYLRCWCQRRVQERLRGSYAMRNAAAKWWLTLSPKCWWRQLHLMISSRSSRGARPFSTHCECRAYGPSVLNSDVLIFSCLVNDRQYRFLRTCPGLSNIWDRLPHSYYLFSTFLTEWASLTRHLHSTRGPLTGSYWWPW